MKKYILFLFIVFSLFTESYQANAQLRPYPVLDDGDGASIGGGTDPVLVDPFGNPVCCETGGEFNFNLTFSAFSNLLALENAILAAQRAAVDRWLQKQEETFRKEINRQMGENYSTFSEAQREFFKFYDGGRYGNSGVVAAANRLQGDNSRWATQNKEKAMSNAMKYHIIDDWIACGYCSENLGMAYGVPELGKYDVDSGPGPKFYATSVRDSQGDLFSENAYASVLNSNRKIGLNKMVEEDFLLNHLSEIRVNHYRQQGWQDRVFLMSYYLIGGCGSGVVSCVPAGLQKYAPPIFWDNNKLYEWSEGFAPKINQDLILLGKDYKELPYSYYVNKFGPHSAGYYVKNIDLARSIVRKDYLQVRQENEICGGISWTNSEGAESFYTNLTNLRLKGRRILNPFRRKTFKISDICIQTPNFNRVSINNQTKDIKIPSHVATTRLKLAWRGAIIALEVDEILRKIQDKREPTEAEFNTAIIRNLNISLNAFRLGSSAIPGRCNGFNTSFVKYCE